MGDVTAQPRDDERGQATVEFAIVIPLLLLLIVGLFQFGKTFNYWISLNHTANEGARWAAVDKIPGNSAPTGTEIKTYITSQLLTGELQNNVGASGVTLCFTGPSPTQPQVGDAVTVSLAAPNPIRLLSGVMDITIRGTSTMRLEQAPPSNKLAGWVKCT